MCAGPGPNSEQQRTGINSERGLESRKIGLIGAIPYQHYNGCASNFPAPRSRTCGKVRMMRTVSSAEEIERIRFASKLTDQSIEAVAEGLKEGMREDEIPAFIEPVYLKQGGYAGIHFMSSMPMRDPDFPVPSQFHSSRKLQNGDCLITEISGAYSGYSGQIHRTFSLGEGPTAEWKRMHDAAVEGFETLASAIKDGVDDHRSRRSGGDYSQARLQHLRRLVHGVNQYPPIFQTKTTRRHEIQRNNLSRKHGDRHPAQSDHS